jgi:hypothetical protein
MSMSEVAAEIQAIIDGLAGGREAADRAAERAATARNRIAVLIAGSQHPSLLQAWQSWHRAVERLGEAARLAGGAASALHEYAVHIGVARAPSALVDPTPAPAGAEPIAAVWTRRPTGVAGGSPMGRRTRISPRADTAGQRSLARENECADALAALGYRLVQNPTKTQTAEARERTGDVGDPDKNPDYLIEGHVFDCYSPSASKPVRSVWSEVRVKIDDRQTERVVVNLHDWRGDLGALRRQFDTWPVAGLKELVVLTSAGAAVQFLTRS